MELYIVRDVLTSRSTTGKLFASDKVSLLGYTLEDTDRGLRANMALSEIKRLKRKGVTAIPRGRYQIVIDYSPRFDAFLPHLLDVPGFEGIRIHPGNEATDVEGCIALGVSRSKDWISSSVVAFTNWLNYIKPYIGLTVTPRKGLWPLIKMIQDTQPKEKIFVTIS